MDLIHNANTESSGLTLLQRALIYLQQHDRIGRRDGFGNMIPTPFLIREIRESLSPEELEECDIYTPKDKKKS